MQDAADSDELRQGVDHGSPWGEDEDSLLGGGTGSPRPGARDTRRAATAADGGALAAPAESHLPTCPQRIFSRLAPSPTTAMSMAAAGTAGAVAVPAGDRWVAPPDGLLGVPVPVGSDYSSDYGGDIEDGAAGSSQAFASGGGYDDEVARWASRSDGIAGPAPARAPSASSSMAGAMGALASASGAGSPSDGPRHRLNDIDQREAFRTTQTEGARTSRRSTSGTVLVRRGASTRAGWRRPRRTRRATSVDLSPQRGVNGHHRPASSAGPTTTAVGTRLEARRGWRAGGKLGVGAGAPAQGHGGTPAWGAGACRWASHSRAPTARGCRLVPRASRPLPGHAPAAVCDAASRQGT